MDKKLSKDSFWTIERHRIKIPTLGFVRLKKFGYIPVNSIVKSAPSSQKADRYYVSFLVEEDVNYKNSNQYCKGIGIDLGLKDFAICSNGLTKKNINKTKIVKKVEKKLKREQRKLSRKYESLKLRNKKQKGEVTRQNIQKQIVKVQKLHRFITIEDLAISNMMKNRHLSKAVAQQKFYKFRTKLEYKCKLNGVELRIADRFYPSSKLCSCCGNIKKDLKLSDRVYKCECGNVMDRDFQASINLANAKIYKIA